MLLRQPDASLDAPSALDVKILGAICMANTSKDIKVINDLTRSIKMTPKIYHIERSYSDRKKNSRISLSKVLTALQKRHVTAKS